MKKEEKKPQYILCPRCELNYINKKDKYCNVCKAEMGLLDPSILIPDEEEVGVEKLCPVCHINYIAEDEDICFICAKEREEKEHAAPEEAENWDFIDEELPEEVPEGELEIPLGDLIEEEEETEEEEESGYKEPDDFDYDVDPNDFIEDEEDEDEEDDDDF